MFLQRPGDVASAMIVSGVVLVVTGAVLPRMKGFEASRTGVTPRDVTRFAVGDAITVTLREDLSLPVPQWVMQTLDAAGFTMPQTGVPVAPE